MSAKLLPSNATALERAVADSTASPLDPSVLRTLWSADHCPSPLLPYLAWAMSVDGWAYALTDTQRRQLIRESLALHRKKGTPWAIQRALGILGFAEARLIEHPPGAHWAEFDVQLMLRTAQDQDAVGNALSVIDLWKPQRSHLRRLAAIQQVSGSLKVATATCLGETSRVMPYQLRRLSAPTLPLYLGATTTLVEVLRIRPRAGP